MSAPVPGPVPASGPPSYRGITITDSARVFGTLEGCTVTGNFNSIQRMVGGTLAGHYTRVGIGCDVVVTGSFNLFRHSRGSQTVDQGRHNDVLGKVRLRVMRHEKGRRSEAKRREIEEDAVALADRFGEDGVVYGRRIDIAVHGLPPSDRDLKRNKHKYVCLRTERDRKGRLIGMRVGDGGPSGLRAWEHRRLDRGDNMAPPPSESP